MGLRYSAASRGMSSVAGSGTDERARELKAPHVIYEWNSEKAAANLRKHNVSFAEAASVFLDPSALTFSDPDHSDEEDREITIGFSSKQRVVFVSHCERD